MTLLRSLPILVPVPPRVCLMNLKFKSPHLFPSPPLSLPFFPSPSLPLTLPPSLLPSLPPSLPTSLPPSLFLFPLSFSSLPLPTGKQATVERLSLATAGQAVLAVWTRQNQRHQPHRQQSTSLWGPGIQQKQLWETPS